MLHARMINAQQTELAQASGMMYAKLDGMSQPDKLKIAYLEQFYSAILTR